VTRSRGTRRTAHALLERRYRRLLGWYPADYRTANEDEILGVALARATPDQRRPGAGEAASLIVSGIRLRLCLLLRSLHGPGWRDAAAIFAILGAVLLAAIHAQSLVAQLVPGAFREAGPPPAAGIALTAGWSLVAAAAMLRWRWATAAGASLGAAGEAALLAARYASDPSFLVLSWWQLTLAVMTALAAVTLLAAGEGGNRPLSWRAITILAGTAAVLAGAPAIESAFSTVTTAHGVGSAVPNSLSGIQGLWADGLVAGLALTLLAAAERLSPAACRRLAVLSVPVAAAAAVTGWGLRGFLASSPRFAHPVLLAAAQWAALGVVPVLGFAAGMILLGRHERMLRLVAAGQYDAS
jgi:hypothetical protein